MPLVFIFVLLYFLVIKSMAKYDSISEEFRPMMCMDISEMRKELLYKEFDSLYRQYMSEVFYTKGIVQTPYDKINAANLNMTLLRDKGECHLKSTKSKHFNSMCPWVYKIKNRLGTKYPTLRREAHCSCDSCNRNFTCMPILEAMTCLEKSPRECDHDGFAKWIPSIEMISVGCVCAQY